MIASQWLHSTHVRTHMARRLLCANTTLANSAKLQAHTGTSFQPARGQVFPHPPSFLRAVTAAGAAHHVATTSGSSSERGQARTAEVLEAFFAVQRKKYLELNPTAQRCLNLVESWEKKGGASTVSFDHLAFRTFGAGNCGIPSISSFLEDFGYTCRDSLTFPGKKLRAFWFAPPLHVAPGMLPRVFVSEILVDELSRQAQDIIYSYVESANSTAKHAFALGNMDLLPWPLPASSDFITLSKESEYAAWTLVNGFSLNHTTISVHRLSGLGSPEAMDGSAPLEKLNHMLEGEGIKLNQQGGIIKVSPDGLLLQSSTVADSAPFLFSDGVTLEVPLSYMEFALRLVLPEFANIPLKQVEEHHRRDGFEVGNADKIFESTNTTQSKE